MKKLNDYSEDIYKCTKCGLCQDACPIFEHTGLECAVSRGKFTLLNGVIKGDLKFSEKVSSYLDLCLSCNACSDFCPSGIEAEEILISAKHEAFKKGYTGIIKNFIVSTFNSNFILTLVKIFLLFYRNLCLNKITDKLFPSQSNLGKKIRMINQWTEINIKYKQLKKKTNNNLKVIYFPGCINTYVNPSALNAIRMVFETNGINYQIPDFNCCGIPARNAGDIESFKNLAIKNLDKIEDDFDYLITDCASCGTVWYMYAQILEGKYKEKALKIIQKTLNINTLLSKIELYLPENQDTKKRVTYHDPCHLVRFQHVSKDPRNLLKQIPNIDFIEMEDSDKCCGASGSFFLSQEEISKKISSQKAQNIINTKANIVSTSCPSCNLGIVQGLIEHNKKLPVLHPVEILADIYSSNL